MVTTGQKIAAGFLTFIFGAAGDTVSRGLWYNCSNDKLWSTALFVPPLSWAPAVMYWSGTISPGTSSDCKMFDFFTILIPIVIILVAFLVQNAMNMNEYVKKTENTYSVKFADGMSKTVLFYLILLAIYIAIYTCIRAYNYMYDCGEFCPNKSLGSREYGKYFAKAFKESAIINTAILFGNLILSSEIAQGIPFIGWGFKQWAKIDYIPGLQHAIALLIVHWVMYLRQNNNGENIAICQTS